jgi:hypothetical protein
MAGGDDLKTPSATGNVAARRRLPKQIQMEPRSGGSLMEGHETAALA